MTYIKQNFEDGQLLNAGHLNYIEDGIVENANKLSQLSEDKLAKNLGAENAGASLVVGENGEVTVSTDETVEVETPVSPVLTYPSVALYVVPAQNKMYYADSEWCDVYVYQLAKGKTYRFHARSLNGRTETYAIAETLFEKPASGYGSGVVYTEYKTEVPNEYEYELIAETDCYIYVQVLHDASANPDMVVVTRSAAPDENDYPLYSVTVDGSGIGISYPYGDDMLTVFLNKRGGNNLFDFRSIKTTTETLFDALLSDWHSPFVVAAVNNADGDAPDNQYFTGGSHQTNNANSGGAATARTSTLKFYADGKLITAGDFGKADRIEMRWTNLVQGYNTTKADGNGREILKENHTLTFVNGKFEAFVELIPLEDVTLKTYYGLQGIMTAAYSKIRYWGGTNRAEHTGVSESGDLTTYCMECYSDRHKMHMEIDPLLDLGKRSDAFANGTKGAFSTEYGKCYFSIVNKAVTMSANNAYYLRGSWEFAPC